MNIEGKSALVTGATRGIGLAIAEGLAAKGVRIFVCARKSSEVEAVAKRLESNYGVKCGYSTCDVRKSGDVDSAVHSAADLFSGLDILINNAGIGVFADVGSMSVEEWQATIETNLNGVFYACHAALPIMKKQHSGYIINIGSLAGKNAFAGGAAYNASKFGLIGFSEALMQDVRHDGIRVSYVMPGSVNTRFGRSGEDDLSKTWKLLPEDVAAVVVSLLESDPRSLASRVEIRPSKPPK